MDANFQLSYKKPIFIPPNIKPNTCNNNRLYVETEDELIAFKQYIQLYHSNIIESKQNQHDFLECIYPYLNFELGVVYNKVLMAKIIYKKNEDLFYLSYPTELNIQNSTYEQQISEHGYETKNSTSMYFIIGLKVHFQLI